MNGKRPMDFPTGCDVKYCPHSGNLLKISFFFSPQQPYSVGRLHLFAKIFLYTDFEG